jgi:hypothetical protein
LETAKWLPRAHSGRPATTSRPRSQPPQRSTRRARQPETLNPLQNRREELLRHRHFGKAVTAIGLEMEPSKNIASFEAALPTWRVNESSR